MRSVPVTILGGSDRKPGSLPESGAGLHPLATYKGVALRIHDRPLISLLVERLRATEGFGPIAVAGPARVYDPVGLDVDIVDTDGSVATNFRAAIDARTDDGPGPLAIMACDVLPTPDELGRLRAAYEAAAPCALWFPFVPVPADKTELGAFGWKPTYNVVLESGETLAILPGHLGIFDPESLRLPLLFKLFDTAYRTRNHSVGYRRAVMLRTVLASLLARDLRLLFGLRAPTRTATIVGSGLQLARALIAGAIRLDKLEGLIGRIFLRQRYCDLPREEGVRLPIHDLVGLAEDIDTEEEARALSGVVEAQLRVTR